MVFHQTTSVSVYFFRINTFICNLTDQNVGSKSSVLNLGSIVFKTQTLKKKEEKQSKPRITGNSEHNSF